MRTTLNIDDEIYRMAKALAAHRGCSVSSVIEESLRDALARAEQPTSRGPLPVLSQSGGTLPGVDLNDRKALRELLEIGGNSSALP